LKNSLAQHTQASIHWDDFLQKVKGENGDHTNDQKHVYDILAEVKAELTLQTLGSECFVKMPSVQHDMLI